MPKLILNGKEYASGIPSNSNFIEETLWTNNDGSGVGTYSLSQNIDNYDFIAIYYGVYSDWTTASNPSGNCTIYSVKDLKNFYNNGKGMIIPGYGNRFVFFDLYDSELKIRIVNDNQTILIVRGIKLAGGVQLANVYSTTEHIIGTWIDGKPLYEKSYTYTISSTLRAGEHDIWNIGNNLRFIPGGLQGVWVALASDVTYLLPYTTLSVSSSLRYENGWIKLKVENDSWGANSEIRLTAKYTKTTD